MRKFYSLLLLGTATYLPAKAQCNADFDRNPNPACVNSPVVFFDLSTGGAAPFTWSWSFGAGAIPATFIGQNPPTVTYSIPGTKTACLFYTSNGGGCTDVRCRNIDIIPQPSVSFTSNAPQCVGQQVNFTYTGSASLTYLWDFGVGAIPQLSTVQNPQGIIYSSSGVKTITLTIDNGTCTRTITQTITISATPTAGFSSTAPQCTGLPVDFTNTGTSAGVTWAWNFGAGATPATSTLQNPTGVVYSTAGTKIVTLTITNSTTGCTATSTQTININQTPTASFTSNAPQCAGIAVNFTNTGSTGGNWSYFWDFGQGATPPTSTSENPNGTTYINGGTKTITFTVSGGGCTRTSTQTITINGLPSANAGRDTTICANTTVQLGAAPVAGNTYSWFPSSTLSSSTVSNPTASPIAPVTSYMLTVTNSATGCRNYDTVIVTMLAPLVANAGIDREICRYDSIQIGAGLIQGQTYSWAPSAGLSSTTSPSPMASPSVNTNYTLTVTGGGCNAVTDQVAIVVHPLPAAYTEQDTITKGSSIQLIATGGLQYLWSPPTGLNNPGIYNPIASPTVTTTYIVKVTDVYGCVNRDTIIVNVIAPSFWVPTAFTPDGNGNNDVFYVRGDGIRNFEFGIYNRWGEMIFYTKDMKTGWDGKRQITGEELPEGAYVYFIKGTATDGTPVDTKGLVNLIR